MTYYVVKVTQRDGWLRVPVVANFPNEDAAIEGVRALVDKTDKVEVKGFRADVMKATFGEIPEGAAVFRSDWSWQGENNDQPAPNRK